MSSPLVRQGSPEEITIACEIAKLAWEPIYEYRRQKMGDVLFSHLFADWRESKAREISNLCEQCPEQFLVVEVDGEIKGFATFLLDEEKSMGIIGNNAVHPAAQGQGLGKLLHQSVMAEFRRRGLKCAQVLTGLDPVHDAARGSYLKAGFTCSFEYGIFHCEL